jgi:hypothetical protein
MRKNKMKNNETFKPVFLAILAAAAVIGFILLVGIGVSNKLAAEQRLKEQTFHDEQELLRQDEEWKNMVRNIR